MSDITSQGQNSGELQPHCLLWIYYTKEWWPFLLFHLPIHHQRRKVNCDCTLGGKGLNWKSFIFKAKSEITLFFTKNMSLARNKKNKGKKLGIVVLSTPPYSCQHQCIHRIINIKYRTCRFILWKALHWVSVVCFWQSYFFGWDLGRCQYAKNAASLLFVWPQHPKWFFSSCPVYIVIPVSWVHLDCVVHF